MIKKIFKRSWKEIITRTLVVGFALLALQFRTIRTSGINYYTLGLIIGAFLWPFIVLVIWVWIRDRNK